MDALQRMYGKILVYDHWVFCSSLTQSAGDAVTHISSSMKCILNIRVPTNNVEELISLLFLHGSVQLFNLITF